MKNRGRPACTVTAPLFFYSRGALFFYIKIALEIADIFLEGNDTLGRDLANGLRIIVFKGFDDIDVACFLELVDLDAQVAGCSVCLFPQISELRFFHGDQQGYDRQPKLGM